MSSQASKKYEWVSVVKWIIAALFVLTVLGLSFMFRERLSLESLAKYESQLRDLKNSYPVLSYGVAFVVYVIVAALSLPGATAMTLVIGWLFGAEHAIGWPAVILVSFASTTGATLAFLLARFLLRDSIQKRFGQRLDKFNHALEEEGAFYLFTLRLIPAVPFFVINAVMGLTPMRVRTYWWVSQLGMLPATFIYVYAGSRVPTLTEVAQRGVKSILDWQILLAFALLGIFPLAVRKLMQWLRT